jgi:hypothetical protein
VVFVILISYAALLVPLGCFLAASVAEIRSHKKGPAFFLRLGEVAFGATALWALTRVGPSESRSWTMVCLSLLLGGLALVSKYASQAALFCVLFGSAALAFLWYFKAPIMLSSLRLQCSFCSFCLPRRPTGYFVILCRSGRTASRSGNFAAKLGRMVLFHCSVSP